MRTRLRMLLALMVMIGTVLPAVGFTTLAALVLGTGLYDYRTEVIGAIVGFLLVGCLAPLLAGWIEHAPDYPGRRR